MNVMDKMLITTKIYGKAAAEKVLFDERGDVNVVSMVVLVAIAVALGLAFKDKIINIIQNIFKGFESSAGDAGKKTSF